MKTIAEFVLTHWLALTAVLIVAGSMALWVRWIMGKVAPVGYEDETGFHHGAKLMPREEVARQLTAALEHRWDEDPEVRQRLGEFKAAPGEYRAIEQERPEAMEITSVRRRAPDAAQGSKTSPLPPLAPVRKSAGRWL
jgi:hypothetical protein